MDCYDRQNHVPGSNTTSGEIKTSKFSSDLSIYWQGFILLQKFTWENRHSFSDTQSYNHHHTIFSYDNIVCHFHLSMFLTALWSKTELHNVKTVWMGFEYEVRIWYIIVICTENCYFTWQCVTNSYFIYLFLFYSNAFSCWAYITLNDRMVSLIMYWKLWLWSGLWLSCRYYTDSCWRDVVGVSGFWVYI